MLLAKPSMPHRSEEVLVFDICSAYQYPYYQINEWELGINAGFFGFNLWLLISWIFELSTDD